MSRDVFRLFVHRQPRGMEFGLSAGPAATAAKRPKAALLTHTPRK
jgi:hypothetical protein